MYRIALLTWYHFFGRIAELRVVRYVGDNLDSLPVHAGIGKTTNCRTLKMLTTCLVLIKIDDLEGSKMATSELQFKNVYFQNNRQGNNFFLVAIWLFYILKFWAFPVNQGEIAGVSTRNYPTKDIAHCLIMAGAGMCPGSTILGP